MQNKQAIDDLEKLFNKIKTYYEERISVEELNEKLHLLHREYSRKLLNKDLKELNRYWDNAINQIKNLFDEPITVKIKINDNGVHLYISQQIVEKIKRMKKERREIYNPSQVLWSLLQPERMLIEEGKELKERNIRSMIVDIYV